MNLADFVREKREQRGWSMSRLAREAGVSKSVISNLEAGRRVGRADTIARVMAVLGADPGQAQALLARDGLTLPAVAPALVPERQRQEAFADLEAAIARLRDLDRGRPYLFAQGGFADLSDEEKAEVERFVEGLLARRKRDT